MLQNELTTLLVILVILLLVAGASLIAVVQGLDRQKRFHNRVQDVVAPKERVPTNTIDEPVSLTKQVSNMDMLKARAGGLIGVDPQQAATYPVPWYVVPPLAIAFAYIVTWAAAHTAAAFGHPQLLKLAGTPVLALVVMKFVFARFVAKRNSKLLEQFPDALSTVVRCVRVGIPMGEALRSVARDALEPTKTEFGILADKVQIGIPLDVALRELSERINMTEYKFFATALTLQARSGGGITQTLETLAEVIRKRVGLKALGYALTAEARMSSYLLMVLPFVAGGAIYLEQRDYILLLFTTASGQSCLLLAILLMAMGFGSIQYLIGSVLK